MALENLTKITSVGISSHIALTGVTTVGFITSADAWVGGALTVGGNITIGGTVTYEDVTNIDSVGIITSQNGLRVTAGGINVTAGVSTYSGLVDVNNRIDVVGGATVDQLNVAGVSTYGGNVDINANVDVSGTTTLNDDVTFTGASNNLLWDKSDNALKFSNNALAYYGSNDDLVMHHTGSTGYIKNTTGTLYVQDDSSVIIGKVTGSHTGMKFIGGGALELYHNNILRASTIAEGIDVTGRTETDLLNVSGVSTFAGNIDANGALDVDGHTELDNVNISGIVTTIQFKVTTGANAFQTSANVFKGASGQKGVYLRSALSSATTPSYSSVDDTNTGIFLPGSDVFAVTTGGSERLRIKSNGDVGIGTDSPGTLTWRTGHTLDVFAGAGNAAGQLYLGANRGDGVQTVGSIVFYDNTQTSSHQNIAIIEVDKIGSGTNTRGGDFLFYNKVAGGTSAPVTFKIRSGGNCEIPNGNLTVAAGHGIDFSSTADPTNGASTSELFDYYEEGTFTPAFGGLSSVSYSVQFGKYTRIGRQVFCTAVIDATGIDESNNITLTGLPYSSADSSDNQQRSTWLLAYGGHITGVSDATARFRSAGSSWQGVKGTASTSYLTGAQLSSSGTVNITGSFSYYVD